MVLAASPEPGATPLAAFDMPVPRPGPGQILVRVHACAVCRTDLHIIDGELERPTLPLVLGHQIVGTVESVGDGVITPHVGDRIGVPWLAWACGQCGYCRDGRENLCPRARFTGYDVDGGYAEFAVADASFVLHLPIGYTDAEAAPLLCAGLIGFRALRACGPAVRLGFYGFGASAHLIAQVATAEGRAVFAFTRPDDSAGRAFALRMGATWAGASDEAPPIRLDAAIIFAPVGALVPEALQHLVEGGRVVCAGIHMSDIPAFPYELLWHERSVTSVANLTRADGRDFLAAADRIQLRPEVTTYPLECANDALRDLRHGRFSGSAVLLTQS